MGNRARNTDNEASLRTRSRSRSRSSSNGIQAIWAIQEEPEFDAILKVLPPDNRGWLVFEVAPRRNDESPVVLKLRLTLPNGAKKVLELVRQTNVMKVNVNPDPEGFDEWTVNGQTFYVQTDPRAGEEVNLPSAWNTMAP